MALFDSGRRPMRWPLADYGKGRGGGSQLRHHFRRPAYNDALTKAGTRGSAPFESSRCPLDAESHILARFLASVLVDWPGIATVPMCIRIENTGIYVIVTKQRTSGRQTVAQVSFPLIRHLLSLSLPPSFSVPRRTYSLPPSLSIRDSPVPFHPTNTFIVSLRTFPPRRSSDLPPSLSLSLCSVGFSISHLFHTPFLYEDASVFLSFSVSSDRL